MFISDMESFKGCETRPWEREPLGQRTSLPIGCFLALIGRKWLLIGCCRSLAFEASAARAPPAVLAHTRTAEEEGTERGACWNPGGKTVKFCRNPQTAAGVSGNIPPGRSPHGRNRVVLDRPVIPAREWLVILGTRCIPSRACVGSDERPGSDALKEVKRKTATAAPGEKCVRRLRVKGTARACAARARLGRYISVAVAFWVGLFDQTDGVMVDGAVMLCQDGLINTRRAACVGACTRDDGVKQ